MGVALPVQLMTTVSPFSPHNKTRPSHSHATLSQSAAQVGHEGMLSNTLSHAMRCSTACHTPPIPCSTGGICVVILCSTRGI